MKKYGDTVLFRRGTITVNALVLQSSVQPDGEHLTIVYLDPAFASPILGGSAAQQAVATAFTVPLKEGQVQGWLDAETISKHDLLEIQANSADNQTKDDSEWEKQVEALEKELADQKAFTAGVEQTSENRELALNKWEADYASLEAKLKAINEAPGGGPPPTHPQFPALTNDEVYAQVKVQLEEKGEVPHVEGATYPQVVDAVNRFLKEKGEEAPAQ